MSTVRTTRETTRIAERLARDERLKVEPKASGHGWKILLADGATYVASLDATPGDYRHIPNLRAALKRHGVGDALERERVLPKTRDRVIDALKKHPEGPLSGSDVGVLTGLANVTIYATAQELSLPTRFATNEEMRLIGHRRPGRQRRLIALDEDTLYRMYTPLTGPKHEPEPEPQPESEPEPAQSPPPEESGKTESEVTRPPAILATSDDYVAPKRVARIFEETPFRYDGGVVIVDDSGRIYLARPLIEGRET